MAKRKPVIFPAKLYVYRDNEGYWIAEDDAKKLDDGIAAVYELSKIGTKRTTVIFDSE